MYFLYDMNKGFIDDDEFNKISLWIKTFGSESSGKFVNGVLGAIYKDILEKEKKK